jgi:hypothetical protein
MIRKKQEWMPISRRRRRFTKGGNKKKKKVRGRSSNGAQ